MHVVLCVSVRTCVAVCPVIGCCFSEGCALAWLSVSVRLGRLNIRGYKGGDCCCSSTVPVWDCCVIPGYTRSGNRWEVCAREWHTEQMGGDESFSVSFITAGFDLWSRWKGCLFSPCTISCVTYLTITCFWCTCVCVCARICALPARFLFVLAAHMIDDLGSLTALPRTPLFSFMSFLS